MKKTILPFVILLFSISFCFAQTGDSKFPALDKSPMDMSYYPANYPVLKIQDKITEPVVCRVVYSRPQKNGRIIFGDLVEYGKVWRLGANEATELEFYKDVKIGGKKIIKGRYTLYAIVYPEKWTFILNKETDTWGSFKYDAKKDVARVDVPVQTSTDIMESLAMVFEKTTAGCNLTVGWEGVRVSLPISFK